MGIKPVPQTMKNTLASDLICRPEYLGTPQLLAPFVANCAMQRQMMYASHLSQSLVLDHCEQPRIMTGYEKIVGKYEFSTCRVDQDMLVREVIPKFNPMTYRDKVGLEIPTYLVIYVGNEDRKVHCMEISRYTLLHDGFGYFNKMLGFDQDLLYKGSTIPKGTKLTTSPSHDGNRYMMGFNANVAFMSEYGVTEDAFIISESAAARGANTAIQQVTLNIGLDMIPLDLYGSGGTYRSFPGIGETVGEDGALIALRRLNKSTFVSDMAPSRLRTIEHIHDEVYRAPPGSKVIDVDVFVNQDAVKKMKDRTGYQQFLDIDECHKYYYDQILAAYEQLCEKEGLPPAPEFNTQVVRAATLSSNRKYCKKRVKLYDAREPIEFVNVVITFAYKRAITPGSKLTGREGGKGVIASIWKDEDMPVDDKGIRADIIMTPASIINRMNPSQLFEQFWNRTGLIVIRNAKDKWLGGYTNHEQPEDWIGNVAFRTHWKEIYAYILGFFNDFRPAYAKFVDETLSEGGDEDKMKFTEDCLNEGLYLINGFRDPIPPEKIIEVAHKYGAEPTPVTYRVRNQDTGEVKTIRLKTPTMIGSKYLMLLGKIPGAALSSIEIGYVSQFELPIKPKSKHVKSQAIIGSTPQRFGKKLPPN